ncbi:MAG: indole-3-glycerol phosphate synthase TrpC [Pseudomonadales bacterium]|nr:indole-3-glycerol phosphate synthase TrpC [Pseudomonadales bacterium]
MKDAPGILARIVDTKVKEVRHRKSQVPLVELEAKVADLPPTRGFVRAMSARASQSRPAVIAEVKKASPSRGVIRADFRPVEIARAYERGGASCLSVLTDETYFQGNDSYLVDARAACTLPVLRKDFTIDRYQLYEARALGADCVLLIAAILEAGELADLYAAATEIGLDVLLEVHNAQELADCLTLGPSMLGINNRDLSTFETNLATTWELSASVPRDCLVVTESGIHTAEDVASMTSRGIYSFLVGEAFMKADEPGEALRVLFGT